MDTESPSTRTERLRAAVDAMPPGPSRDRFADLLLRSTGATVPEATAGVDAATERRTDPLLATEPTGEDDGSVPSVEEDPDPTPVGDESSWLAGEPATSDEEAALLDDDEVFDDSASSDARPAAYTFPTGVPAAPGPSERPRRFGRRRRTT